MNGNKWLCTAGAQTWTQTWTLPPYLQVVKGYIALRRWYIFEKGLALNVIKLATCKNI